jgi:beta-glucanase (GH16 family)
MHHMTRAALAALLTTLVCYNLFVKVAPGSSYISSAPAASNDLVLTFHDEFDGDALDRAKWRSDYWNGGGGEKQEYVNDDSRGNYILSGGTLKLRAKREAYAGKAYTSGIITTQGRFAQQYGVAEVRAKLPAGKGLWPAFWLLPNPTGWPPEIDVMENLGYNTHTVYMTLHYAGGESEAYYSLPSTGPGFADGFHTFRMDWRPDAIAWYIDGQEVRRYAVAANIPAQPMFFLLDLAVGGNWPGDPDGSTVFPADFEIDYIRVWQHVVPPLATPTTVPTVVPPPAPTVEAPQVITGTSTLTDTQPITLSLAGFLPMVGSGSGTHAQRFPLTTTRR